MGEHWPFQRPATRRILQRENPQACDPQA
jgi:hypothetical protein